MSSGRIVSSAMLVPALLVGRTCGKFGSARHLATRLLESSGDRGVDDFSTDLDGRTPEQGRLDHDVDVHRLAVEALQGRRETLPLVQVEGGRGAHGGHELVPPGRAAPRLP